MSRYICRPLNPPEIHIERDRSIVADWRDQWRCCMVCRMTKPDFRGWQVHHIIGSTHRSHEPCNLIFLCAPCHDALEAFPNDTSVLICLAVKRYWDLSNYNRERIEELLGRRIEI